MIKAIAIDDEPPALRIIEHFCTNNHAIELLGCFTDPNQAAEYLQNNEVDLLFIDIQMPENNGIDFYSKIENKPFVIFTTAFSEYAVEGFNLDAVDYLLKPYTKDRFQQAIQKAENKINSDKKLSRSITLRTSYSLKTIPVDEILFIESFGDYIKFHFKTEKELEIRLTLKKLSEILPPEEFVRVHRSYIVSLPKISEVRNKTIFIENEQIPISASYAKEFFERFLSI